MSTIVLIGGSFLGAWAWERVTPPLTALTRCLIYSGNGTGLYESHRY